VSDPRVLIKGKTPKTKFNNRKRKLYRKRKQLKSRRIRKKVKKRPIKP
jgi:hypothetical protein